MRVGGCGPRQLLKENGPVWFAISLGPRQCQRPGPVVRCRRSELTEWLDLPLRLVQSSGECIGRAQVEGQTRAVSTLEQSLGTVIWSLSPHCLIALSWTCPCTVTHSEFGRCPTVSWLIELSQTCPSMVSRAPRTPGFAADGGGTPLFRRSCAPGRSKSTRAGSTRPDSRATVDSSMNRH